MITLLSITAALSGMVGGYYFSRGTLRTAYRLGIVTGSCYAVLNCLLALRDGSQTGMLLLIVPSLWGVTTSILGLRRLQQ